MGAFVIPWGVYRIFQWNGKDLIVQGRNEEFFVLSRSEISAEQIDWFDEHVAETNREIEVTYTGKVEILKTPSEQEQERVRNDRITKIMVEIAGIEDTKDKEFTEYAQAKLESLRQEMASLIRTDPTAVTLEQKRANASWEKGKK